MKRLLQFMYLVLCMLFSGMICFAGETESTDWAGDLTLVGDGVVSFSTDCLGYSWNGSDYYYNNLNGYPEEGMVDSLGVFAVDAINEYYEDIPSGCVLAHVNVTMPGFENMIGISTGVCYPTDSPTTFSSVYALTDTNHSVVIALTVCGFSEGIVKAKEDNYKDGVCQYSLDEHFEDILDTFWFGESSTETEKIAQ